MIDLWSLFYYTSVHVSLSILKELSSYLIFWFYDHFYENLNEHQNTAVLEQSKLQVSGDSTMYDDDKVRLYDDMISEGMMK